MTEITKEAIEVAKSAYWHEAHNGGGYSDKCYEAALTAALPFLAPIAGEEKVKARDDTEMHYFRSILRNLREWRDLANETTEALGVGLADQALADNIDWLDCFIDMHERSPSSPGKDGGQEVEAVAAVLREMQAVATGEYEGYDETLDPWTADNRAQIDEWQVRMGDATSTQPASTALVENLIDDLVKGAEVEWSYRDDDHRYPREFWHARITFLGYHDTWTPYGEQEQRELPESVKLEAETNLRDELRAALHDAFAISASSPQPASTVLVERLTTSADEIWIEPNPPADPNRGQDWSETNAWGQQATKYVRADIAETLLKVLEPFAKEADKFDPIENDDHFLTWGTTFTIGDLRRARASLKAKSPSSDRAASEVTPHSFAQEYEFRGDTDYTPTDGERTMIEDAICGYLAEGSGQ